MMDELTDRALRWLERTSENQLIAAKYVGAEAEQMRASRALDIVRKVREEYEDAPVPFSVAS